MPRSPSASMTAPAPSWSSTANRTAPSADRSPAAMMATLVRAPRRSCSARIGRGDRARVAKASEQDDGTGCRSRCGDGGAVDRHGVRGGVQRHRLAALDGIRHRRREPEHIDHDDDVARRESGEAVDAPLEADLVGRLVEGMLLPGHPSSVRGAVRTSGEWSLRDRPGAGRGSGARLEHAHPAEARHRLRRGCRVAGRPLAARGGRAVRAAARHGSRSIRRACRPRGRRATTSRCS